MAVVIEAVSVIVRNSTLAEQYPGGLEAYCRDCPNTTFCADENLSRVGMMAHVDADKFVAQLAAKGLTPFRKGASEDVAMVSQNVGLLYACTWLELGQWGKAMIAWLAGTKRGDVHAPMRWNADRQLQFVSAEQQKRLKFVRSENNVDVYVDEATGEEMFLGRSVATAADDKSRHNELYQQGQKLIDGLLILDNQAAGLLDLSQRRRLEEAIRKFTEVVQINPANWAAMWILGKIYQRLELFDRSLAWFARAHRVKPEQPDVAREASIAAMEVGKPEEAVEFCKVAIEANPSDAGLQSNLALALLFSGNLAEAEAAVNNALARDPSDKITASLAQIVKEVRQGRRPQPRHVRDLR